MGTMHAQAYQQIRRAGIVALVDKRKKQAESLKKTLGIGAGCFEDLESALSAVDADAVDICLPTPLHEGVAIQAIRAGKAVFLEKPIAGDMASAGRIVAAAKRAGVSAQIGHCIRFWPEYQALEKLVRTGRMGRLLSLSLQRRSALPGHSMGSWLLDGEQSGGAALDLHIHDTDFILHLLGAPKAVTSSGTTDRTGISHIFTTYHFDGIAVVAEGGWNYPKKWGFQMAFQAVFERGTVEYDSGLGAFLTPASGAKRPLPVRQPSVGKSKSSTGNISSLGGYFNELDSFVSCLEAGRMPSLATPAQAAEALAVALAEIQSVRSGRTVTIKSQP